MLIVPLDPVPAQAVVVTLGGQDCTVTVQQKSTGLYCTLAAGGVTVVAGVIARHAVRIVRDAYLGFAGDLAFYDTLGTADPLSTGLGTRWVLAWLSAAELGD